MSEKFSHRMGKHLGILQRYMRALETGDLTTLADVLRLAEHDSELERLLLETNLVYQAEDHLAVSQEEVASALAAIGEAVGMSLRENHAGESDKEQTWRFLQDIPEKERMMDDPNTFTPTLASKARTSTRPPRRAWVQTLVAVLVLCVLVGGFLVVFNAHSLKTKKPNTLGAQPTRPAVSPTIPATNHLLITSYIDLGTHEIKVAARRADTGKVVWSYNLSPAAPQQLGRFAQVTVQNQVVYATTNGQIYALHANTGQLIWQRDLHPARPFNSITYDHGMLYLTYQAINAQLYAVAAQQGNLVWRHAIGTNLAFTVSNRIVYIEISPTGPYASSSVVAVASSDGHQLWTQPAADAFSLLVASNTLYLFSGHQQTPSDVGGNKQNKTLAALNATTGHPLWRVDVEDDGIDSLVAGANLVILYRSTATQTQFCAYSGTSGTQAWCTASYQGPRDMDTAHYQVVDNVLLATYSDENFNQTAEAISLSTGQTLWSRPLNGGSSGPVSLPMLSTTLNGVLYLAGGSDLIALRAGDGKLFWQVRENSFLSSIAMNG